MTEKTDHKKEDSGLPVVAPHLLELPELPPDIDLKPLDIDPRILELPPLDR